jgi:hypothetical protein
MIMMPLLRTLVIAAAHRTCRLLAPHREATRRRLPCKSRRSEFPAFTSPSITCVGTNNYVGPDYRTDAVIL